ncbi:MAG: hypothetical protein KC416_05375 [Myxococcales bacterium]|nr:hypothetical protein [Myxococcales bacterium]
MRFSAAFAVFLPALILWSPAPLRAEDEVLRLYGEPTSYTDVIDALDGEDPFDFNVRVGFERRVTLGTVEREDPRANAHGTENFLDVANHEHVRNTLMLGVDIGLYRDLALFARFPIVLSDDRSLSLPANVDAADVADTLSETGPTGTEPLFSVPFQSPTRSGLDYFSLGLAYAIFNQYRDPHFPTWIWMIEGQIAVGEPMNPCFDVQPATASARCYGGTDPGASEGLHGLRIETRASKRYRYLEPYMGFAVWLRWPGPSSDLFSPGGDLEGFLHTTPPTEASVTLGTAIIPWENRGRSQRVALDLRGKADYVSEGRSFSPLFDALGTSQNDALRTATLECPTCTASVAFSGLTDTQAHARLGGRAAIEIQAAQYIRFVLGGALAFSPPYYLTYADACNVSITASTGDPRQGACRTGITNPHHRSVIDTPGKRFRLREEISFDLFATAIAQF